MTCNSNVAGRRAQSVWETGIVFVCIWGTFDLLVFKVILGLFGALSQSVSGTPLGKLYLSLKQEKFVRNAPLWYVVRNIGLVQERICATSRTFDNGQVSGPNMAILKISQYLRNHCSSGEK